MSTMDRRQFLARSAGFAGTIVTARTLCAEVASAPAVTRPARTGPFRANDVITLGKTGIKASRLAIGTGTRGGGEQRKVGIEGMVKLLRHGFDQGVRWWDVADMYQTHPHVRAALAELKPKREEVTITSKTWSRDAQGVRADLERFHKELNTDYIDILLLHCQQEPDWPAKMKGPMEVLSEAKQKGIVRAVGCSCHGFSALQAAADEPWVEVSLARINPFAENMDVAKPEEVPKVRQVLETMHRRGKVVYGMKILGEGSLKDEQIDKSLRFVLGQDFISGFAIGFSRPEQIDDIARRIERSQPL